MTNPAKQWYEALEDYYGIKFAGNQGKVTRWWFGMKEQLGDD
jgi:hypothetical protein